MTSETMPKTENAVAARGLTKTYGHDSTRVEALRNVTVSFERSRFTAIMGPSGSGKSTLMHCLAGLDTADSGEIVIGGKNLLELSDDQLTEMRREQIGFVFQSFNLVPTISAKDNILLPLSLAGKKHDRDWFNTVIQALGLRDRLNHKPHELSGGQQQRVAVARALLTRPEVVFGDEPTGNLDSRTGAEVLSLMRTSTREMGQTIIMVTHDPVAASYADTVLLMKDGSIVGQLDDPTVATVTEALASLAE
ncbi:ABC transporter ATP-binding protein [Glutamicibacter mysorens]|uniref:ABC transporter ATP-binding protein n=1 Tax=Glutamicibacter mysorens TaxID=257984 RepID=UPI0020C627D9|nr:ABC transporter ATP-binding protein [Glutamicibacter mysorens]UTM48295.1 ABC transporter ATP-binding protein [Glutamicibacter mysorens]